MWAQCNKTQDGHGGRWVSNAIFDGTRAMQGLQTGGRMQGTCREEGPIAFPTMLDCIATGAMLLYLACAIRCRAYASFYRGV